MKFRQCTVGGMVYGTPPEQAQNEGDDGKAVVLPGTDDAVPSVVAPATPAPQLGPRATAAAGRRGSISEGNSSWPLILESLRDRVGPAAVRMSTNKFEFDDDKVVDVLANAYKYFSVSDSAPPADDADERMSHARTVHDFFTCVALCHGVVVERADPGASLGRMQRRACSEGRAAKGAQRRARSGGSTHVLTRMTGCACFGAGLVCPIRADVANTPEGLRYSAQSPDEVALVEAARNFGYVFITRVRDLVVCEILGQRYAEAADGPGPWRVDGRARVITTRQDAIVLTRTTGIALQRHRGRGAAAAGKSSRCCTRSRSRRNASA